MRIALDYGTKTAAAALHIGPRGTTANLRDVIQVEFAHHKYHEPMVAGWPANGPFMCGKELDDQIRTNHVDEKEAFRLIKLALYPSPETEDISDALEEQLRSLDKTYELFIAEHLRVLHRQIMHFVSRTTLPRLYDIEQIDKEYYISVPQMWNPSSTKVMVEAAKRAGLGKTQLVYEPQCAAAYALEAMLDRSPLFPRFDEGISGLGPGDVMQVADLGGGTADFASYQFESAASDGASVGMRVVGVPTGSLAGSEFININFLEWLACICPEVADAGGIEALSKTLNLSVVAFRAKASEAFEREKTVYPWNPEALITVSGKPGGTRDNFVTTITHHDMRNFFEPVAAKVVQNITDQIVPETKIILTPGGFGRSEYLINRLREMWDPQDGTQADRIIRIYHDMRIPGATDHIIPTGALLRYANIDARGVPAQYSFGTTQVEEWNPEHHPDATHVAGSVDEDGKLRESVVPDYEIVKGDAVDPAMEIVKSRWVTLIKKGTLTDPEATYGDDTWQVQYLPPNGGHFKITLYWTDGDIADHEPIYEREDGTRYLREDVHVWNRCIIHFDPAAHRFGINRLKHDGRELYEVWWRLRLQVDGANVKVVWQILKDGKEPFVNGRKTLRKVTQKDIAKEAEFEISAADYSPFPRS